MTTDRVYCRICNSTDLMVKPFGYEFNGQWLEAKECRQCGMIFLHPQPTADELTALYSKEYFEGDFRCGHEGSYFDDATLQNLSGEDLLRRIKTFKAGGKFLEIGCAGGAFLNAARTMGYEVQGIEFSKDAAEFARQKFKLDVITGDLSSGKFPSSGFDVVFMGDVLEHVPDPVATLTEIHRILKEGGLLVILCPMQTNTIFSRCGFMLYGLLGKRATVHLPPYHLFEYRSKSMMNLLHRQGFTIPSLKELSMSPSEIGLRGSFLQNSLKKLLQYPNYAMTKIFGIFGDRIEVYATKQMAERS